MCQAGCHSHCLAILELIRSSSTVSRLLRKLARREAPQKKSSNALTPRLKHPGHHTHRSLEVLPGIGFSESDIDRVASPIEGAHSELFKSFWCACCKRSQSFKCPQRKIWTLTFHIRQHQREIHVHIAREGQLSPIGIVSLIITASIWKRSRLPFWKQLCGENNPIPVEGTKKAFVWPLRPLPETDEVTSNLSDPLEEKVKCHRWKLRSKDCAKHRRQRL